MSKQVLCQQSITTLFEEQVNRSPEAVVLEYEDQRLTYGDLNRRANQLAHYLRELGVRPEERVAICVERSLEMVVGLLGVLKAGGAYVPLDPASPMDRLRFMLEDSAPLALLTQVQLREKIEKLSPGLQVLDLMDAGAWSGQPKNNLKSANVGLMPEHLAYMIYTSGSTGNPKGVLIEHHAVANRIRALQEQWQICAQDRVLQFASIAFDVAVEEVFGTLLSGATLVLRGQDWLVSAREFWGLLEDRAITVADLPTRFWSQMVEDRAAPISSKLRLLIIGGEAVEARALANWFEREGHRPALWNAYGPTETTINATLQEVKADASTWNSIGRPIANTQVYILDGQKQPVPAGVTGELYIAGAGVARGYWNRPELTAEVFLRDPFAEEAEARMYKSGDLGRWLPDGTIEFAGRNDDQVKIHGYRIELGEIVARLLEHEDVEEAAVVVSEKEDGDKRLVAYYVADGAHRNGEEHGRRETAKTEQATAWATTDKAIISGVDHPRDDSTFNFVGSNSSDAGPPIALATELRSWLASKLPEYMLPAAYVQMERLPLTENGKLDRKGLPTPEAAAYATSGYEAPKGEMEIMLADMWAELLQVERVGRQDNFFALGGHSLQVVTLMERMGQRGFEVDAAVLFSSPTLAGLSAALKEKTKAHTVTENRIPIGAEEITPQMLPLAPLTAEEIHRIVSGVKGGAPNVQDIYPLTPLQEGILFHHLMAEETDPYLLITQMSFDTRLRLDRYLAALQKVIDRHDILRTSVAWEGLREPLQVVWRSAHLQTEEVELNGVDGDAATRMYAQLGPRRNRLDVRQAPMLRAYVGYNAARDRWLLSLLIHHLSGDHTTEELIEEEIEAQFSGLEHLLPAPLPFRNLVVQARFGMSQEEHEAFFRQMLADVDEPTAPFGLLNVQGDGTEVEEDRIMLGPALSCRLRAQARTLNVSPASLCHLAWGRVLAQVSDRADVVFGTVLSGRMQGGLGADRMMGLCMNTLPVRLQIGKEAVVASARKAHRTLAELMRHEHAPLVLAQRCSGVAASTPLFSALLNFHHGKNTTQAPSAEGVEVLRMEERTNYPLTLSVEDLEADFRLMAQVQGEVGARRVCQYMHTTLESLVTALEADPDMPVSRLLVLPHEERRQLLYEWNETGSEYPRDKCVHELFEEQVEKTPEAVAVVFEEEELSYRELNARANRLAHYLRELGVRPDDRVGICAERSLEMVVGLLAILKAGGAYVPVDPNYPAERLQYIIEDSTPVALLTLAHLRSLLQELHAGLLVVDISEASRWQEQPEANPDPSSIGLTSEHLAYVIYTSGSTGTPKGVTVQHGNVVNSTLARKSAYQSSGRFLLLSPISFDSSVAGILGTLTNGDSLLVATQAIVRDPSRLSEYIEQFQVQSLLCVPSLYQQIIEDESRYRHRQLFRVIVAGEPCSSSLVAKSARNRPHVELCNEYGPTEATVWASMHRCSERSAAQSVPIGRPIANTRTYILDGQGEPAPVGVAGELYIGGAGVARGYQGRPALTAEKFVPDPYALAAGARMYRTGDLARWLADGNIEFLGRNDFQVKIRGFRIELGEIEARLMEHPSVREAAVVAREDTPGDKRLVAYYTAREQNSVGAQALRAHSATKLPEYMVPTAYVRLESLPLTANGKLNRKALPAPKGEAYAVRQYEAPQGAIEELLAGMWAELLKLERVGRQDNFFELGGHSLLGMRLLSRIRSLLGVEVAIRDLFAHPVLMELARAVESAASTELSPIVAVERGERLPLSFGQQRLWFLERLGSGTIYIVEATRVKGALDYEALRRAVGIIVERHEILRTRFVEVEGQAVQVIEEGMEIKVGVEDVSGLEEGEREERVREAIRRGNKEPFDLENGPLLRVKLLRLGEHEHVLLVAMHHIVSDGWSMGVLARELRELYGAAREQREAVLEELPMQYGDYAAWQRESLAGGELQEQMGYWKKQLEGLERLELPTDHPRPAVVSRDGATVQMELGEELSRRVRELCRREGVTQYMVLLGGLQVLLGRYTGQQDVAVGTLIANRTRREFEPLIGFFANTLVLRGEVRNEWSFREMLKRVREVTVAAYVHQDVPFDYLMEELQTVRDIRRSPLLDVMLNMHDEVSERFSLPGLSLEDLDIEGGEVETLLATVPSWLRRSLIFRTGAESAGNIRIEINYVMELYEQATIERMGRHFRAVLEEMTRNADSRIGEVTIYP